MYTATTTSQPASGSVSGSGGSNGDDGSGDGGDDGSGSGSGSDDDQRRSVRWFASSFACRSGFVSSAACSPPCDDVEIDDDGVDGDCDRVETHGWVMQYWEQHTVAGNTVKIYNSKDSTDWSMERGLVGANAAPE